MSGKILTASRIMGAVVVVLSVTVLTGLDTASAEDFANANRQTVTEGGTVLLDGLGADGFYYNWSQIPGEGVPTVTLSGADSVTASFQAPAITVSRAALDFRLEVLTEAEELITDTVQVTVFDTGISHTFLPPAAALGASLITGDIGSFVVTDTLPITGTVWPPPVDIHLDAWFGSTIDLTGTGCVITSDTSFTTTMTLFLPSRVPPLYSVARLSTQDGRLYPLSATFNSDRTQVSYVLEDDNVEHDDDPTKCIIEDPVAIVLMAGQLPLPGGNDDDGGCGCFVTRTDNTDTDGNKAQVIFATLAYGSLIVLLFWMLRTILLVPIRKKEIERHSS